MTTGFVLLDQRNPHGQHFYSVRRGEVLAYVMHITAGLENHFGADSSAEATARYAATTDRSVSWHVGTDADSIVPVLPESYTAFHVQGYNSVTIGHEISKATTDWRNMPADWRRLTLERAALAAGPRARAWGIPFRQATRAELDREIAKGSAGRPVGFIGHGVLDPTRRTDPGTVRAVGDTFPWSDFLRLAAGGISTGEIDMDEAALRKAVQEEVANYGLAYYAKFESRPLSLLVAQEDKDVQGGLAWWSDGAVKWKAVDLSEIAGYSDAGLWNPVVGVRFLPRAVLDRIPLRG